MKTSSAGIAAIMQREGVRLTAYKDSIGVWTIGVGHTGRTSPPKVTPKMKITTAQVQEFLTADLAPIEAVVNSAVKGSKVPITQSMFDAMVSFAFNIGASGFAHSTVVHLLGQGNKQAAASAFLMWKRPPEIVGRRMAERKQFLS